MTPDGTRVVQHPAPGPAGADRVQELLAAMTLEEKLAQLVGLWEGRGGRGGGIGQVA